MSILFSSRNIFNKNRNHSSLLNNADDMNFVYNRSDVVDHEKNIPNIFTSEYNQLNSIFYPSSVLEREKNVPNIFNFQGFCEKNSTHSCIYTDKFVEYSDLFTLNESYSQQCILKNDLWEKYRNYASVFSLSDLQLINCVQNIEIYNSNNAKQENHNSFPNDKVLQELSSEKEIFTRIDNLEVNKLNTTEKSSISKENFEDNKSSAYCFWCIVTGINVRDHNLKTYFPQREISNECMMKDIKLMLINMGTTYFLVDNETHMYKRNGNISISGLTPEMFESATDPILECSNLYKIICNTIMKWKEIRDDSIVKAFIFAVSNILNDYEQTIYAFSNESLMTLVGRVSNITPRLHLLANICGLKNTKCIFIPNHKPCGVNLLNKVHSYLFEYRFPGDQFLKMLLYIFESCCLAYLRILSNWALKGLLNNEENCIFIKLKPDIVDEDNNCRQNWDCFIIDESIEVPMFLDKYKKNILHCGKTINFFNKFNDLNVFLPELTCCFDVIDSQKVYEQFSLYFKFDSDFKTASSLKRMSNSYLFESVDRLVTPKKKSDSDDILNENITTFTETMKLMYCDNENYEFFQIPDWTSINNSYEFNKPHGFFIDLKDSLTYNEKPFDVINMIDYVPHSILIPARIQKSVCDKQILDMYFVQENLMGHLYFLSQCFFLMNSQFSTKLSEALFNGIATNRQNPVNIFNSVKLKSIVDEAIQDFSDIQQHNLTLENTFIPRLNGVIDISDIECLDLKYCPEWPMNMILPNKILLKYNRIFLFANKLAYVSWSLFKARELLNEFKNDTGLQYRKINLFKHSMNQFVSSIQQYYKQVVISSCWSELNETFENVQNYDDIYSSHKQYMHLMLKRCFMVVGCKDKLILLNKIYIEILAYYQALASGQFYIENSERLHSEFFSMEQSFSRFVKLRETFYNNILKTVLQQIQEKHSVAQFESLITILGPLNSIS